MDIVLDMSSLSITAKKRRRLSGYFGTAPPPGNETDNTYISNIIPSNSESDNIECPQSSSLTLEEEESSEMGKTDPNLEVRRSSRRKSVINNYNDINTIIQSNTAIKPLKTAVQEFNIEEETDLKLVKKIYLDKRVKRTAPTLETIFETPVDGDKIMTTRKFKRSITFQDLQKNKVRKIPMKAKQAVANYNKTIRKSRITNMAFKKKLADIEDHDADVLVGVDED